MDASARDVMEACLAQYVRQSRENGLAPDARALIGVSRDSLDSASLVEYRLTVGGRPQVWLVADCPDAKFVVESTGLSYFQLFNKRTGFNARMGRDSKTDPTWCPLGPEILDLEISVHGCPRVGGHACRFCYKGNTDRPPTNLPLADFMAIVDRFPRNLSQIALGITGVQTNPDFPEMLRWLREERGIVPNYTLSGVDLTDPLVEATVRHCGRVAVSVYEADRELCYRTLARFHALRPNFCNVHLLLSNQNMGFVDSVLDDVASGRVVGLRNLVFLRCKPVGRASNLDCSLSMDNLAHAIDRCQEVGVSCGFDSCSCGMVEDLLRQRGMDRLSVYTEPCESSRFSSYVNVHGQYSHCSFCEHLPGFPAVDLLADGFDFHRFWIQDCQRYRDMDTAVHCPCLSGLR